MIFSRHKIYVNNYFIMLKSFHEKHLNIVKNNWTRDLKELKKLSTLVVSNILIKDMIYNLQTWRHIRGYPAGGSTTHTNSKSSKKNKILLNFRLDQFFSFFGEKKRNIYPTLIKAEYNNRLWFHNWHREWKQASKFVIRMINKTNSTTQFNPVILAQNQTNGYIRINKAAKISKSKKLTKVFTIGVPVFFSRWIFLEKLPKGFWFKLVLKDTVNKRLGKKIKRKDLKNRKKKKSK